MTFHVADAHAEWKVVCIGPDFCLVDKKPVAFEIFRDLTHERLNYSKKTRSRGEPILTTASVIAGVVGNMGEGLVSTVSRDAGDTLLLVGSSTVLVEGQSVCRDQDLVAMNVKT